MVLERKNKEKRKKIKRYKEVSSWKTIRQQGPSNKPDQHTFEKSGGWWEEIGCMSVPSYKGSWLQDSGRPWYRGYGTIHETRTGYLVATWRSKDSTDCRETPLSWASELIPQSIEEILQLKGMDVERPQPPVRIQEIINILMMGTGRKSLKPTSA